ncbi:MAG: hypothetical protein WBA13_09150 [Microcoleaceae cyanobacterium]
MRNHYFLVIDDLEKLALQRSGFLVELEGGGRKQANVDKIRELIELLWIEGKLPEECFINGFSEENIIMVRTKKDVDRELLPIEEAGNYLIELIELVAAKTQAQQEYIPLSTMVEKIFTGREQELTAEEIQQAQDSKTIKSVISKLTRAIADVELCRKNCQQHTDLIMGIIQLGENGESKILSTEAVVEAADNGGKQPPKNSKAKAK